MGIPVGLFGFALAVGAAAKVRYFSSKATVPVFDPVERLTTVARGSPGVYMTSRILNSPFGLSVSIMRRSSGFFLFNKVIR
jgi:hypothetical protein